MPTMEVPLPQCKIPFYIAFADLNYNPNLQRYFIRVRGRSDYFYILRLLPVCGSK